MQLSRFKAAEAIRSTAGRIFGATFIKKDGTERTISARVGVHINPKGGKNAAAANNAFVTVYDMANRGYRMVNLETLQALTIGGQRYEVV